LISWQWLVGEAEALERGRPIAAQQIQRRLTKRERVNFPGGQAELGSYLEQIGETLGDLRLEVEAELASARLGRAIASHTPVVTSAEVASYYEAHRASFVVREKREVAITNTKTYAKAQHIKEQVEAGMVSASRFPVEVREMPSDPAKGSRPKLEAAIRRARRNVITGPIKQLAVGSVYDYFVFELKRVVPAVYRSLPQVALTIKRRLSDEAQRRARSRFIAAWRKRWTALTDCSAGYVVQGCRQYRGPRSAEGSLELK
jgi:parvulin-like peptidyl-prolyl cis-trans isomerase-like protein